jgi:hypothetical protein
MSNPNHKDKFTSVKDIIDRERGEALDFFRKLDFESRLSRRLEADLKSESPPSVFLRKPVLIFSASVLLLCLTAVLFQILSPSPHERSVKIIEEFLLKNTNLQEVLTEETAQELELKTMTISIEDELKCWQNPACRKKIFNQIMNVFKEKKNVSKSLSL